MISLQNLYPSYSMCPFKPPPFSRLFKSAIVISIHKKCSLRTDLINNFRPISLLSSFSKILEKFVANRLTSYLEHYKFLLECQFGFCSNCSTSNAVSHFLKELDAILSSRKHVIEMFCNLTKAFDCVDHSLLLSKLFSFDMHGPSLQWFQFYLSSRCQQVKVPSLNPLFDKTQPSTSLSPSSISSSTVTSIPPFFPPPASPLYFAVSSPL